MTESEAKKRWCPFVRMHSPGSGACNRETQTPDMQYYKCIASGCMAWRDDEVANQIARSVMENEGHGFCGLAGKP